MRQSFFVLLAAPILVPAIAPGQAKIVVGPNVHVSSSQAKIVQNEVLLSASPSDPNVLIACTLAGPVNMVLAPGDPQSLGDRGLIYVSTDRGRTWRSAGGVPPDTLSGDNHCIIAPDGRMHFVTALVWYARIAPPAAPRDGGLRSRIVVRSSADSGRTWHEGSAEPPTLFDREYFVIDDTRGPYRGRIYLSGTVGPLSLDSTFFRTNSLALWRSLDGGKTFEHPITVTSADTAVGGLQSWNTVMLSNGTVVFPFVEWVRGGSPVPSPPTGATATYRLKIITSTDGGASFGRAQQVARFSLQNPSRAAWAHSVTATAAADRSNGPFRDRVYVAWFQSRDSTRGHASDIMVAHSPDGGRTWSVPMRVNDDPGLFDSTRWAAHVMPTIAVNKDGVVGLMWYDRRDHPSDPGYSVRFSASLDGGETWAPSVSLSEKPMTFPGSPSFWTVAQASASRGAFPATVGVDLRFNDWLDGGHTAGLAADAGGKFHAIWVDNRTGIHQLWGAGIDVTGRVAPVADAMVAGLDDAASKVRLALTSSTYDDESHTVVIRVRLRNASTDTLRPPVRVVVTQLTSQFGNPHVVGADNARDGVGAVWDFSALIPSDGLMPAKETEERALHFRLGPAVGYEKFVWARTQSIVRFDARVLTAPNGRRGP